jgi:Holliday junction resolvase
LRLKNPKAKGSRLERVVKRRLEAEGKVVIKAGASLGPADIVALDLEWGSVELIQVKANRPPAPKERMALKALQGRCGDPKWHVQIWVKPDRKEWEIKKA